MCPGAACPIAAALRELHAALPACLVQVPWAVGPKVPGYGPCPLVFLGFTEESPSDSQFSGDPGWCVWDGCGGGFASCAMRSLGAPDTPAHLPVQPWASLLSLALRLAFPLLGPCWKSCCMVRRREPF